MSLNNTMNNDETDNQVKRNPSILKALDSVHRSLLLKNMQYEGDLNPFYNNNNNIPDDQQHKYKTVLNENNITTKHNNNTKNTHSQTKTFHYTTASEMSLEMQNVKNSECEKTNKKCENGICVCFSSDSDDVRSNLKNNNNNNYINKNMNLYNGNNNVGTLLDHHQPHSLSGFTSSDETKISSVDDKFYTSYDCSNNEDFQFKLNTSDSIILRTRNRKKQMRTKQNNRQFYSVDTGLDSVISGMEVVLPTSDKVNDEPPNSMKSPNLKRIKIKIFTKRQNETKTEVQPEKINNNIVCLNCSSTPAVIEEECTSNSIISENHFEEDEYHDCKDFVEKSCQSKNTSNSSASFYEDTSDSLSNPIQSNYQSANIVKLSEKPAIHIIQEITESMTVTSNITINKEKLKLMQSKKQKKKSKVKKKIIDDNFCNEILDQTLNWNNLTDYNYNDDDYILDNTTESSYDIVEEFTIGKLEASPKYSGKIIGDLMKKRLRKAEQIEHAKSSYYSNDEEDDEDEEKEMCHNFKIYTEPENFKSTSFQNTIQTDEFISTDSGDSYKKGPKKPPRTFASNSSKLGCHSNTTVECENISFSKKFQKMELDNNTPKKIGWNFPNDRERKIVTPTCPTYQQLGCHVGWIPPDNAHYPEGEWIFVDKNGNKSEMPQKILNMLNYESNSSQHFTNSNKLKPEPQQDNYRVRSKKPVKENIDTVDSVFRLRSTSSPRKKIILTNEFDNFAKNTTIKSTPEKNDSTFVKKLKSSNELSRSQQNRIACSKFLDAEKRVFSLNDIQHFPSNENDFEIIGNNQETCEKCRLKKKKNSISKMAVKRTKTFLEAASKKKIPIRNFIKNAKTSFKKFKPNSSDSELYMTPQKSDTTSNMNRLDSARNKKFNKNLELSQHNWTCTSCMRQTDSIGSPIPNLKHDVSSSKSTSSNTTPKKKNISFEQSKQHKHQHTPSNFDFNRLIQSPKQSRHEFSPSKFKLSNFHLSPRRLFKTTPTMTPNDNNTEINYATGATTTYKSFHENDQELMALMGEFLSGIRSGLEENKKIERNNQRIRRISTSSEILDKISQKMIKIDMHDEPIYEEIKQTATTSSSSNSKRRNEDIKSFLRNESQGNYYMANNNPKAIYAIVNKQKQPDRKTKSLNNMLNSSDLTKNIKHNTTTTSTTENILLNDIDDIVSLNDNNLNLQEINYMGVEDSMIAKGVKLSEEKFQLQAINYRDINEIFVETERHNPSTNYRDDVIINNIPTNETYTGDEISSYDASKFLRCALGDEESEMRKKSPSPELSSDSSSEFSEKDNIMGYDTVDMATNRNFKRYDSINDLCNMSLINKSTIDKRNASADSSFTTLNSPNQSNRHNQSTEFYRSFKEKLRNSFRKGKNYIRQERKRLSEMFDDKTNGEKSLKNDRKYFGDLDQYKSGFNDCEAEKLYQTISSKLNDNNSEFFVEEKDQYLLNLINQISYQRSIRHQLSNAVNICRNTREFQCSAELIEAERLLLLSNLKEAAAKTELIKNDYSANDTDRSNMSKYHNKTNMNKKGSISLGHFEFSLKDVAVKDTLFNYFYICICSCRDQVISTIAKERNGNIVTFSNCGIQFNDIEPDYQIRVEVFVLRLRKNIRNYSHESKYHLNKEPKSFLSCPTPPKMSPGKLFHTSSSSSLPKKSHFNSEFSQFKTQGFAKLTSYSLTSDPKNYSPNNFRQIIKKHEQYFSFCMEDLKEFELNGVAYNSNLLGKIWINLKSEIFLESFEINGFLNVGEKIDGITNWNRRWCKLDGLTMLFWNYPPLNNDEKPLFKIDLIKCVSDSIKLVDRTICAKTRTFSIEMFGRNDNSNQTIKLYFLSADNQKDLNQWMSVLNDKIKFLRDWSI